MGLEDRRTQDKDHWVKPDEALQRRSGIAQAWAKQAADDPRSMQALATDIDPSYIEEENDTSQGDVARAYMQVEREADHEERMNYEPPTYDIEDTDDVQAFGT